MSRISPDVPFRVLGVGDKKYKVTLRKKKEACWKPWSEGSISRRSAQRVVALIVTKPVPGPSVKNEEVLRAENQHAQDRSREEAIH